MRVGILGAGISGLSLGKMLSSKFEVELLERENIHGGIARTKNVNGIAYHKVGGHCFNSKYPEVLKFVFDQILDKTKWHNIDRDAVIKFKNNEVSYPIEFAVKQIFDFDPDLALNITKDFLAAEDDLNYSNLEDWFRKKFGNTLADNYFLPYNQKIWNKSPSEMSPAWVDGKLPIPNKRSFFNALIGDEQDKMPHSNFYYPDSNDQNTFIDNLADGLNIVYNYNIEEVEYNKEKSSWIVNNEREYDILISTLPLNILPLLLNNVPSDVLDATNKLRYNKVTTMLWETKGTDRTWTYVPEKENFFHRYIHIGSFHKPKTNVSITEVVGIKSYDEMIMNGKQDPFLVKPLDYNVSDHAYVVFDENYEYATTKVKEYISQQKRLYTHGRFGEWQYYNMDICIKQSLDLAAGIFNSFSEVN